MLPKLPTYFSFQMIGVAWCMLDFEFRKLNYYYYSMLDLIFFSIFVVIFPSKINVGVFFLVIKQRKKQAMLLQYLETLMYFETQYDPRHINPWLFIRPHLWHGLLKFYVLRVYNIHTKQAKDSLAMAFTLERHLSEEAKNVPNGGHLGVLPCEVRERGLYPKVG